MFQQHGLQRLPTSSSWPALGAYLFLAFDGSRHRTVGPQETAYFGSTAPNTAEYVASLSEKIGTSARA